MALWVDVSNYSAVPDEAQAQCWADRGIEGVVIGLQNARIARLHQIACRRFRREYYVDLPGRSLLIPEARSRVWIDVEPGCFTRMADIRMEIETIRAFSMIPGIYGNETSIAPVLGTSTEFSNLPLMYANYTNGQRVPSFDEFRPFNGWERPTLWQYAGSTELCGINVDLDVMEDVPVPDKDGWLKEDTFWVLYNGGVEVLRIGSGDGAFPGRISKLFGDKYLWLRAGPEELERPAGDVRAVWSEEEGD